MASDDLTTALLAEHRRHVVDVAYRILGDRSAAEDVVQDAWLQLHDRDLSEVRNARGYLTTVVSRLALDELRSARMRRERYVGPWLPEPVVTEHVPDPADRVTLDESVSLALLAVLERLSPAERTSLVLHDVFGMSFDEIATVVGRSDTACRQLAARARRHVRAAAPRYTADRAGHDQAVRAFAAAMENGDLERLVAVLDQDVVWRADGGGKAPAGRTGPRGRRDRGQSSSSASSARATATDGWSRRSSTPGSAWCPARMGASLPCTASRWPPAASPRSTSSPIRTSWDAPGELPEIRFRECGEPAPAGWRRARSNVPDAC